MESEKPFISFLNLSKQYGGFPALDSVTFDIRRGEIFGYVGPNGAGKTTTIKILVGLIRDYCGEYLVEGLPACEHFSDVRKRLGYLPQNVAFQDWRTTESVLKTFGELSAMNAKDLDGTILDLLRIFHLSDARRKKVSQLSGGMLQKLGFAQALLNNPDLLVLDEPLNGLDPSSRHDVKEVIRGLSAKGKTVIFSSHILSDVEDIAHRVAIIDRGRILATGTPLDLTAACSSDETIEVTFFHDADPSDILKPITEIDRIDRLSAQEIHIHLRQGCDREESGRQILSALVGRRYSIRSYRRVTPTLDDVYLRYIKNGE